MALSSKVAADRPRAAMFCLTLVTGLAGFLFSFAMLGFHVTCMWLRYGLSVTAAYTVFLGMIWCWTRLIQGSSIQTTPTEPRPSKSSGSDASDWLSGLFDYDCDGILPVILVLAAFVLVTAIFYTVSLILTAPELLGEIAVDGAAGAMLYRRLSHASQTHWLGSVFRRTRAPFFAYLAFFICAGISCHLYAPEASSIGGVIRHFRIS